MADLKRDNKMSDYVEGLYVKNGRMMNDRMPGVTGIQQAAMYRKQMKKQ